MNTQLKIRMAAMVIVAGGSAALAYSPKANATTCIPVASVCVRACEFGAMSAACAAAMPPGCTSFTINFCYQDTPSSCNGFTHNPPYTLNCRYQ